MNRCPDNTQWVLYAADELPVRRRRALEAHLEGCPACRREVEAIGHGLSALAHLDRDPAVRPEAIEGLHRRLRVAAARKVVRPSPLTRLYRYRWAAAAAVLVALALTWAAFPPASAPRTDWMDETQFIEELAEITAGVEMLEVSNFASAAENGADQETEPPKDPDGQTRRTWDDLATVLALAG